MRSHFESFFSSSYYKDKELQDEKENRTLAFTFRYKLIFHSVESWLSMSGLYVNFVLLLHFCWGKNENSLKLFFFVCLDGPNHLPIIFNIADALEMTKAIKLTRHSALLFEEVLVCHFVIHLPNRLSF